LLKLADKIGITGGIMAVKKLKKLSASKVTVFKIKNRRGFAGLCMNNLTEGSSQPQVLARMKKALRRAGYDLV